MNKFLITGIGGFTGTHLAKLLLDNGHEVHGMTRQSSLDLSDVLTKEENNSIKMYTNCNLLDLEYIKLIINYNKYDGIFHLAAMSHPPTSFLKPIFTFNINVMGTVNLIEAMKDSNAKLMYCSTSEVYGNKCKDTGILRETDKLEPNNPYGVSKACADIYVQERMNNGFINAYITRAFSNTGPRRPHMFSISSDAWQIAMMMSGLQEKVLRVGNLKTKRCVIDVRDVVKAYYQLMMEPKSSGRIFNICGENIHEMQYYADKLIEISGLKDVKQEIDKNLFRPIDIEVQLGDSTEIKKLINWEPKIPIETILHDLLYYWVEKLNKED